MASMILEEEPEQQELEAHYWYMEKIQEVLNVADDNSGPTYDAEPLEKTDRNVISGSSDMCNNEGKADQNYNTPISTNIARSKFWGIIS
ncbi:hypothetical protein Tco_0546522 [Tanacetum coccineum]|uniref:Uncharacterized protein n=1 Tax=Tanacetum coccineum TaxID=301880 RepID=A0ABQ5H7J3_9ASTR